MRGNAFLDKMELIDPAYIEAADAAPKKRKNAWVKWGATAACLCLVIASAFLLPGVWNMPNPPVSDPGTSNLSAPESEDEGDIASAPESYPEDPYNRVVIGGPNNIQEFLNVKPMISGYGEISYNGDMTVTNGDVCFSQSLQSAMENYGEEVNYRVLIELFHDGVLISSGSELALKEAQRLVDLDYTVARETYTGPEDNGGYRSVKASYYFTLHAAYDQLKDFPADDNLGYSIMLYDEYFGKIADDEVVIFNGFAQDANETSLWSKSEL